MEPSVSVITTHILMDSVLIPVTILSVISVLMIQLYALNAWIRSFLRVRDVSVGREDIMIFQLKNATIVIQLVNTVMVLSPTIAYTVIMSMI